MVEGTPPTEQKGVLVKGFRITVVLLINLLSVSISYITSPLALSTRVVFRGEFFVKTSFITAVFRRGGRRPGKWAETWRVRERPTPEGPCSYMKPSVAQWITVPAWYHNPPVPAGIWGNIVAFPTNSATGQFSFTQLWLEALVTSCSIAALCDEPKP